MTPAPAPALRPLPYAEEPGTRRAGPRRTAALRTPQAAPAAPPEGVATGLPSS